MTKCFIFIVCVVFSLRALAEEPIVVDEDQAEFDGRWQLVKEKKGYSIGPTFKYAMATEADQPTSTATFRPNILVAGKYHIEVHFSPGKNRSPKVPCLISGSDGPKNIMIDQTQSPLGWHRIADDVSFEAGTRGFVQIGNNCGVLETKDKIVLADAVRLIFAGAIAEQKITNTRTEARTVGVGDIMEASEAKFEGAWIHHSANGGWAHGKYTFASSSKKDSTATYRPNLPKSGRYDVYIWYSNGEDRASDVPWQISAKNKSQTISVDQKKNGGDWFQIGEDIEFDAGSDGFVRVLNQSKEKGAAVIADAVAFVYVGE